MKLNRFRVLELMEREGIRTQAELADRVGVSRQSLSSWLRGGPLTLENLGALCSALRCTPNDILVLDPKELALAGALV